MFLTFIILKCSLKKTVLQPGSKKCYSTISQSTTVTVEMFYTSKQVLAHFSNTNMKKTSTQTPGNFKKCSKRCINTEIYTLTFPYVFLQDCE